MASTPTLLASVSTCVCAHTAAHTSTLPLVCVPIWRDLQEVAPHLPARRAFSRVHTWAETTRVPVRGHIYGHST